MPYRGRKKWADASVPIVIVIVTPRMFPSEGPGDGRFPKEMISVKKCRPRVGDSIPDRELSSTESSTPSMDDVKSEKL